MKLTVLGLAMAFVMAIGIVACTSTATSPLPANTRGDVYRIGITGVT